MKPINSLATHSYVTSEGDFQLELDGSYGWAFPDGEQSMNGVFDLSNDAMLLEGTVVNGDVEYSLGGQVTADATRSYFQPPQTLMDELATAVNGEVLPRIEEARAAWEALQEATADYEFELSLRGLRDDIPPMVDVARDVLAEAISSVVASQRGELWYEDFKEKVEAVAAVYDTQLAQLKAAAQNATDNATTRAVLERELRETAARKIFSYTYRYVDPVFGVTLYSVTISQRILSDEQANALIEAADNVYRIQETSDLKIQMRQIYESVNERKLFEQVRDDLRDGVLVMRDLQEMGFVYEHGLEVPTFDLYAEIDGRSYDLGSISALTLAELMTGLPDAMIKALKLS